MFKSSLEHFVGSISFWAELAVGPIMIWLGIVAIKRNHKIAEIIEDHKRIEEHDHTSNAIHLHGKSGEEIGMNPMNRSFWVGMLHGLAGTGGALTSALVLSTNTAWEAIVVPVSYTHLTLPTILRV